MRNRENKLYKAIVLQDIFLFPLRKLYGEQFPL